MQDTEKFYPLKGYEGYYEITKSGIIKSLARNFINKGGYLYKRKEVILKTSLNNKGYVITHINIKELGIQKTTTIHKLVAINFVDNPNNYCEVNHLDGNKLNNNNWNLEWTNRSKNNLHRYRVLEYENTWRKLSKEQIKDVYLNTVKGENLENNGKMMCDKYKVTKTVISRIINNKAYLNITKHLKRKGE